MKLVFLVKLDPLYISHLVVCQAQVLQHRSAGLGWPCCKKEGQREVWRREEAARGGEGKERM